MRRKDVVISIVIFAGLQHSELTNLPIVKKQKIKMENIEYRKGAIDATDCISEGWNFLKSNYLPFLGMVVRSDNHRCRRRLDSVCGRSYKCGRRRRGENVSFGMMFEGFSRIVPVTLVRLVSAIPVALFGLVVASFFPPAETCVQWCKHRRDTSVDF